MMPSISSEDPGSAKPMLRPDAAHATCPPSRTTTDQPRSAISRATVRPSRPATTTHTSTSRTRLSRGRPGRETLLVSYQPASMLSLSLACGRYLVVRGHSAFGECMLNCSFAVDIPYHDHAPTFAISSRQGRTLRTGDGRPRAKIDGSRMEGRRKSRRLYGFPCPCPRPRDHVSLCAHSGNLEIRRQRVPPSPGGRPGRAAL